MKNYKKNLILSILITVILYSNLYSGTYEIEPDVNNCVPGKLSTSEKTKILNLINNIRARHKMGALTWNEAKDILPQSAALSMAATGIMSHDPVSGKCSSKNSDDGRKQSNLMLGYRSAGMETPKSEDAIIGWLIDANNAGALETVGHRRLIINPFLKSTCFGKVDAPHPTKSGYQINAAALWGITSDAMEPAPITSSCENDFVAYPYGNYPVKWVDKTFYLNFCPIPDKNTWWAAGPTHCDLSKATITMKDESGKSITVSDIQFDYSGWGALTNNLSWKAAGLKDSVKYTVKITNVTIAGTVREFEYWFKITDDPVTPLAEVPKLVLPLNNAKDITVPVTFKWNKSKNAISYDIQGSLSSTFTYINFEEKELKDTSYQLTQGLTNGNKYYWRVVAYNADGIPSKYSDVWIFNTKEVIPDPPVITYPNANDNNVNRCAMYRWTEINEAIYYNLQISTTDKFDASSIVVDKKELTDNRYELTMEQALEKFTNYYCRVNASINAETTTKWSEIVSYKTNDRFTSIEDTEISGAVVTCFPNPVINKLNISINSDRNNNATIEIYNILGMKIKDLFNGVLEVGTNNYIFNSDGLLEGIYFCKVVVGNNYKIIPINFNK